MLSRKYYTIEDPLRLTIVNAYRMDETQCVKQLVDYLQLTNAQKKQIQHNAFRLIESVRCQKKTAMSIDALLQTYQLNTQEGIALMCLAEALLRVPDKPTKNDLINDKIHEMQHSLAQNKSNLQGHSFLINATIWGLLVTGKMLSWKESQWQLRNAFQKLLSRASEPVIRGAVMQAMKLLGQQFVMEQTIDKALKRAKSQEALGFRYSYDMLGEAAMTEKAAKQYLDAYLEAINAIGQCSKQGPVQGPGISVKLSALHPRYELSHYERVFPVMLSRLKRLALAAKQANIAMTIDAEEANRLDFSLDLIEAIASDSDLNGWEGFGLALQSYQKRAFYVIDWLAELAKKNKRRLKIRLIKGAYWDSEIKDSQVGGYERYPVFTRKMSTDVSFLACAKKLLSHRDCLYPQFATHNAYSVAAILTLVGNNRDFEFQCLHGMGQTLYHEIVGNDKHNIPCRVYAPVGDHAELLPYLVRRLLENGANTSFVNQLTDHTIPVEDLIADPIDQIELLQFSSHTHIPLPEKLYGDERKNSAGIDLSDPIALAKLQSVFETSTLAITNAKPVVATPYDGKGLTSYPLHNPSHINEVIGNAIDADEGITKHALQAASEAADSWAKTAVEERVNILLKMADQLHDAYDQLLFMLVKEAGKTIPDAIVEVREAIDFCRYYAVMAKKTCENPQDLTGPTGELNQLQLYGRGPIVCISPWNFPLAIFIGQISAALVAGNPVLAKPAEQTLLIATYATQLFHEAGIPKTVLQLLPGKGEIVGAQLVASLETKGVMFTGSTQTARLINQTLANREGPIMPFIAETGGQNTMIVDSTALPEQVVRDVILSAFGSAGQRCSALRVLYVQDDIADRVIDLLIGAMAELIVGDPSQLSTDVGSVIDKDALQLLRNHYDHITTTGKLLYQVPLTAEQKAKGYFFAPCAVEIDSINQLTHEVFGPFLHVIRYPLSDLDQILQEINNTGYGLTFGIHSRMESRIKAVCDQIHVGNVYVNRNMIGAVVGVQPFGGEGLSGTGPKAGGPHYLLRLCTERTLCVDTTAAGGNTSLFMLKDK